MMLRVFKLNLLATLIVATVHAGTIYMAGSSLPVSSAVIPPAYVSDVELAEAPIIVIAKWDGAAFVDEGVVEGNIRREHQVRTSIVIERVIKGEVAPGVHSLLVGFAIGWSRTSPTVASYMSTEMIGDAQATESTIWFLQRKRSIHEDDEKEHLYLDTYRGVQPLALEAYFLALKSKDSAPAISALIDSENSEQVVRALHFICGDDYPCYPGLCRSQMKRVRKPIQDATAGIEQLLDHTDARIRRAAAWAYADLLQEKSIPKIRPLLEDNDQNVNAIAIATLLTHGDRDSVDAMQKSASQIDGWTARKLIRFLAGIKDERIVPVLIGMLQTGGSNDYFIPGFEAQAVLLERTGVLFPYDVRESLNAWKNIRGSTEESTSARNDLQSRFRSALEATLVGNAETPRIRVTNTSKYDLEISGQPDRLSIQTPNSMSSGSFSSPADAADGKPGESIILKPGQSTEHLMDGPGKQFFTHKSEDRVIKIAYFTHGRPLNKNSWAGELVVETGEAWDEPKTRIEVVELRWPNGNLKVRGQKTNGVKSGEWTYFNEAGDRIRSEKVGGSTSEYNPEHPDNKGLGKKN